MKKCTHCYLRDAKPCYECSECKGGDNHFKLDPDTKKSCWDDCKEKTPGDIIRDLGNLVKPIKNMNCIHGGKTAKQSYDEKELLEWVQGVTPRYSALIEETGKKDKDLARLMLMAMDSFMANQFRLKR